MTRGREKRLLLAWMALLVPLPLPFNEPRPVGVVGFPFLGVYVAAIALLIFQVKRGRESWLTNRALNVLGALYTPFLVFDLVFYGGSGLVTPMMHLALFALAAKLYSLRRERDKWHIVIGLFFVFVTAMATSASPGIVLYLIAFLVLWATLLARFAHFHVLAHLHQEESLDRSESKWLAQRFIPALCLAVVVLSVPLFFAFPRLRNPFLFGTGTGLRTDATTGFSDQVSLDGIGRIRTSREVAMRVELSGQPPGDLRFRGAAYELYGNNRWERVEQARPLTRGSGSDWILSDGRETGRARIWLEPLGARSLLLPPGALAISFRGSPQLVLRHRSGSLSLQRPPLDTLYYEVSLGQPEAADWRLGFDLELDRSGVTPEIAALAADVVQGMDTPALKARAIESYLSSQYGYTLDFVGREGRDPVGEFLFRYRSGHCELFATSMVLMLRAVDVPARLVTGFSGAETSALGYYIVRQSNAHAWVEAYIPGRGWTVFDPTPPAGRPSITAPNARALFRQAYDFVVFGWDRYVISYGISDQRAFFERFRGRLAALLERFRRLGEGLGGEGDSEIEVVAGQAKTEAGTAKWGGIAVLALVLAVAGVLAFLWLRRRAFDGRRAYERLRSAASARGVPLELGTPPRELAQRVNGRFPEAGRSTARIVDLYLRESYGGATLSTREREELNERLADARKVLRRAS